MLPKRVLLCALLARPARLASSGLIYKRRTHSGKFSDASASHSNLHLSSTAGPFLLPRPPGADHGFSSISVPFVAMNEPLHEPIPEQSVVKPSIVREVTKVAEPSTKAENAFISTFEMFSIGIGPSSSHTIGPMRAAKKFICSVEQLGLLSSIGSLRIDLYGSLALTGEGHGTPRAIILGLLGEDPESVDPLLLQSTLDHIDSSKTLQLIKSPVWISFDKGKDLVLNKSVFLKRHSNASRFSAFDKNGDLLATEEIYSVGGGFIASDGVKTQGQCKAKLDEKGSSEDPQDRQKKDALALPFSFSNFEELSMICKQQGLSIAQVIQTNEKATRHKDTIELQALTYWHVMETSIRHGCTAEAGSLLPGALKVKRRAPGLLSVLIRKKSSSLNDILTSRLGRSKGCRDLLKDNANSQDELLSGIDWLSVFAIAVNEQNAAGGRVVTAPTNGASGTIPAVLKYYLEFMMEEPVDTRTITDRICTFLFTASGIGMLYKHRASISAAEVGCQGEVGVASSMAAGALTAVLGGSVAQIGNAAEIAMEHHLGLTCDPPEGLVQIPCIERNAMGAMKAVTAARLALCGHGEHRVSLDQVMRAMKQTGDDMSSQYKETSLGGLAVNVPVC